ncbi:MAG: histidinol dehydrogenase [Candidatus Micrarchaeota archaeon]|nr:histidinol dehydrogenase [Candidatus Micrarchaeota archaeon]
MRTVDKAQPILSIKTPEQFRKRQRPGIPKEVFDKAKLIAEDVRIRGFSAVAEYSRKIDDIRITEKNLKASQMDIESAHKKLALNQRRAIDEAFERVKLVQSEIAKIALLETRVRMNDGFILFRPRPMSRIGIYVPGGIAPLPSSLLMAGVTARAAGVKDIVVCTPPRKTGISAAILYVAIKLGIFDIYRIGGAQAISAMAYGISGLMEKTDMVCGPGNVYAAAAKQVVSSEGIVKIDMIAGPSEVVIIADGTAKPDYLAADMLAQAEHGTNSSAILLTDSIRVARDVIKKLECLCRKLKRKEIAARSIQDYGAIVLTKDINEAIAMANYYAPEHLEIFSNDAEKIVSKMKNAGAVFVNTCEAFADYGMSGGNHILPTGGTARFLSGLSVYDFLTRTYVEKMTDWEQKAVAELAGTFADIEGLEAHANAARQRNYRIMSPFVPSSYPSLYKERI